MNKLDILRENNIIPRDIIDFLISDFLLPNKKQVKCNFNNVINQLNGKRYDYELAVTFACLSNALCLFNINELLEPSGKQWWRSHDTKYSKNYISLIVMDNRHLLKRTI